MGRSTAAIYDRLMQRTEAACLGQWRADRVWTFGYSAGRLVLRPAGNLPPHRPDQRLATAGPRAEPRAPAPGRSSTGGARLTRNGG